MNRKVVLVLLVVLLAAASLAAAKKAATPLLPEKYQNWLDLVAYIVTKEERAAFFTLTNDRDRDAFIKMFWKQRDPTPGTEENEYLDEHIKRFNYANQYFKYGSARAGWKTDMGRIYILLGQPQSIDRYEEELETYPVQIWSYAGTPAKNLPLSFWMVFWKHGDAGEYKIYDPAADGPRVLIRKNQNLNQDDYQQIYTTLADTNAFLAQAAFSLLPDEMAAYTGPSMISSSVLANVFDVPRTQISSTNYATQFLRYKGVVNVDYANNYIECQHAVLLLKDPLTGLNFVHFAIQPKTVSAAYSPEKDQYFIDFKLSLSLKQKERGGEKTIFEYFKSFPFYYTEKEMKEKFSNSAIISDYFPVVEGEYELTVVLENSVQQEFSYFDQKISVAPAAASRPLLYGPMLAYQVNTSNRLAYFPFKFQDLEIRFNTKGEFSQNEKITVFFAADRNRYGEPLKVEMEVKSPEGFGTYSKSYSLAWPDERDFAYFNQELERMKPGVYALKVRLLTAGGVPLAASDSDFSISLIAQIPHPISVYRMLAPENSFLFYHQLATQCEKLGKDSQAESFYQKALSQKPDYAPLVKDYANLLLRSGKYEQILTITEAIRTQEKSLFDYHALRGKAFFHLQNYAQAAESLQEANKIYDSDVGVLNALGLSYMQLGQNEEAKRVLRSSLKLKPDQKDIEETLKKIK